MGWRAAKALNTLRGQLDERFPGRTRPDWMLGDSAHRARRSDHNPDRFGVVRAVDLRDGGGFSGKWLFDRLRSKRDPRLSYVIYDGQWFRSYRYGAYKPWTVVPYRGSNPHRTHVHVSVGGRNVYDDWSPWDLDMRRYIDKEGHETKRIQQMLVRLGIECPVNGKQDEHYRRAVKEFNGQFGSLHEDGGALSFEGLAWLTARVALR